MSEMPDGCCILEVTIAETGYVLRIWNDGHATLAWPSVPEVTKRPYATALAYDEGKRRFAERQRAVWGPLIAAHDGTTQGPFIEEGTLLPNKMRAEVRTLVFRTRGDTVHTATIKGDLRASASLGPFETPWNEILAALWGPEH